VPWGAALSGLGSAIGGIFGGSAASSAAQSQADAAKQAIALQQQIYGQTSGNLAPFLQAGTMSLGNLASLLGIGGSQGGDLSQLLSQSPQAAAGVGAPSQAPTLGGVSGGFPTYQGVYPGGVAQQLGMQIPNYNMPEFTAAQYQQSPGYQFELQQGLGAIQNAAVPGQGSISGNTLKALQTYGTGLANQDFQQAYNNYTQNYQNQYNANNNQFWNLYNSAANQSNNAYNAAVQGATLPFNAALQTYGANNQNYWNQINNASNYQNQLYSRLFGLAGTGQNAAVQQGGFGQNYASNTGNLLTQLGNAGASGTVGSTNALLGGLQGVMNSLVSPTSIGGGGNNILAGLFGGGGGTSSLANNAQLAALLNSAPNTY
jgi:hypothetical protein